MPKTPTLNNRPTEDVTWDGSPLTRYVWQKDLPRRLTRANPSFRTLCEYGYVLERGKVVCASPSHRDNLYNNNVARNTFQKPCELLNFTVINGDAPLTAVPEDAASRYVIAPEILIETDSRMFEEIAESILNPKRRDDYNQLSTGSGVALLRILTDELSQQSPELGAWPWAASEIASLQLAGITAPTIAAFDDYREKYEDLNGQLDAPATEASLAAHYFAQVRRLGDLLSTRLKLRMTVDNASGDLTKTVSAITAVLNETEASSGTGQALYGARDPVRGQWTSKGKGKGKGKGSDVPKRTWTEGKDELCSICNGEENGGRHLRKDCPRFSQQPPKTQGGRGGARVASSYPHPEYDDDDAVLLDDEAIAQAFQDGLPPEAEIDSHEAAIEDVTGTAASAVGAARVARGRGRGMPGSSPPFSPMPAPSPHTPSTQSSIQQLTPNSPVTDMRSMARELGVSIDLSVGGKARRTKFEILQDLRHAAGLPPMEPPTGIPLGAGATFTAPATPSLPSSIQAPDQGQATASAATTAPAPATHEPTWPWKGGPPRSLVCIVADGNGGALHQHTFATAWSSIRDAAPSTFTCPLDGPPEVDYAPAGSVWLGARDGDGMQLWGQRDGTLVCSLPRKTTKPSSSSASAATAASPSPTNGLGVSSFAALIVAMGALLITKNGSSSTGFDNDMAKLSSPHDPGIDALSLLGLVSCPCFFCLWILTIALHLQASHLAKRGPWALLARRRCKYKPTTRSRSCNTTCGFSDAASLGWQAFVQSILNFSPPWLVSFYLFQWLILAYMRYGSRLIGYRTALNRRTGCYAVPHGSSWFLQLWRRRWRSGRLWRSHATPYIIFGPCLLLVRWARGDCSLVMFCAAGCGLAPWLMRATTSVAARRVAVRSAPVRSLGMPPTQVQARVAHSATAEPVYDVPSPRPQQPAVRVGRAALSSRSPHAPAHKGYWKSRFGTPRWMSLVVDSGCTWHIHNKREDLVNLRPCHDVVIDAHGRQERCASMGDLPLVIRDAKGRELCLLLRGVRLAESFTETLLSVDQLWASSGIDTIFRNERQFVFTRNAGLRAPFRRVNGSFVWEVGLLDNIPAAVGAALSAPAKDTSRPYDYKGEIHSASASSHIHALPANGVAALLHRRLHVGIDHIRRLMGRFSIDAPAHVASASRLTCEGCSEANATHISHSASRYQPSHVGRLIHADIVGPFLSSYAGSYKYGLVLVDDHSRYKSIKFLRAKSDAPSAVRAFVAELNAGLSTRAVAPVRVVGSLHTDNAGEFLSREFKELLDSELVAHTTCPPHVHQLNGVAERAIRSILQLARAYLTTSGVGVHHWPAAFEMAVDVLNRTSGPPSSAPGGGPSSFEVLTGVPPRVMHIMPFGCRAFVVKPRAQYSKTTLDPRAWVGVNLGRCATIPGAYRVFVPSTGRVVHASDVYFLESYFPCRPRGSQIDDTAPPIPLPAPGAAARAALARARSALASAYSNAVARVCPSRRVLLLFSGPQSRPDGMAAFLAARGVPVDQVDSNVEYGGGAEHDILNDVFFSQLLKQARSGKYGVVFAAPPCSTYSVSRYFKPKSSHDGPPPVRSRKHILGLPDAPPAHRLELRRANEITRRTAVLLMAAHRSGAEFIVENPVDRGDPANELFFQFAEHGPIWLDPFMQELGRSCGTESATFAQCMFGASSQKYTTLWFTAGLAPALRPLRQLICSHAPGAHLAAAGGVKDVLSSQWNSTPSASYPPDFNLYITETVVGFFASSSTLEVGPQATPTNTSSPMVAPPPMRPPMHISQSVECAEPPLAAEASPRLAPMTGSDSADEPPAPLESSSNSDEPAEEPAAAKPRAPIFRRGLGPIHLRSRGAAHSARPGDASADPTSHAEAMRLDSAGWSASEASEIDNHERAQSWRYMPYAVIFQLGVASCGLPGCTKLNATGVLSLGYACKAAAR